MIGFVVGLLFAAMILGFYLIMRSWYRSYLEVMREGEDGPPAAIRRPGFRRFLVVRHEDVSGVSGTGIVCEGIQFSDTHAAIHWIGSKYPWTTPAPEGVVAIKDIHGHGKKTELVWVDGK